METIKQVLMRRDGLSEADAREAVDEAIAAVAEGQDPEEVLLEHFGLEPDYIFDLM